ncbi:MAG TPA: ABC transporter permease [Candidatus Limnocylindria bacterium]|jgi:peptide/nickel transport system permease protein|nr:ABC transporter permease [Candidatus Limnocylindria bacterium]
MKAPSTVPVGLEGLDEQAVAAMAIGEAAALTARPGNLWRDTAKGILRQRSAQVGLLLLTILITTAVLAPVIAPYDPEVAVGIEEGLSQADGEFAPCVHLFGCPEEQPQHILGLDRNGRDVFSRVVWGSRVSLYVGVLTVGFAIVIGSVIGATAGFVGGGLDNVLMRIMDILLVFPALVLAIAIVTVLGAGLINAQIAIGLVAIPIYARVMRASVLSVRERDFITASLALGESRRGILFRRIFPNSMTPLIVAGTLGVAGAILEVAALSFLGLGAQPPLAEWGSMIALDRNQLFNAPWLILAPGIALTISVLGFNLFGDGLRDALDPRLNR